MPLFPLVDRAYGRAVAEETREESPVESLPLSPSCEPRLTRAARRVSRLGEKTVTVTRACTYMPKRGRRGTWSGGALCRPGFRPQDHSQDVSDPGSGTRTCSRARPGGRSRPGCRCGSHLRSHRPRVRGANRATAPHPRVTRRATRSPRGAAAGRLARAWTGVCLSPSRGDAARELVDARDRLRWSTCGCGAAKR